MKTKSLIVALISGLTCPTDAFTWMDIKKSLDVSLYEPLYVKLYHMRIARLTWKIFRVCKLMKRAVSLSKHFFINHQFERLYLTFKGLVLQFSFHTPMYSDFQKPYKVIESQLYHAVNLIINLNLMSCVKRILKLTSVLWQNYAAGMEILVRAPLTRPVILERR